MCIESNNELMAEVRNKLGPMQTVLDLIKIEAIKPENKDLKKIWNTAVKTAQKNINIIKKG